MSTESEFETHATDPTRAEYYLVRGAFEPEADMRADFTVGYRHWQAAQETAGAERQALLNQHEELARKWCPPGAPAEWGRLDHAVAGWERYPRQMREHGDWIAASQDRTRGELPIDRRTQQHARELTGHSTWERVITPEQARDIPGATPQDRDQYLGSDTARVTPQTPPSTSAPARRPIQRGR